MLGPPRCFKAYELFVFIQVSNISFIFLRIFNIDSIIVRCPLFIFSGVAVMFCYINQLFLMCPAICLNEIRTSKRRHFCICCLEIKERDSAQNSKNPIDRCLTGNIPESRDDVESSLEKYPKKLAVKIHLHFVGKIMICILFMSYLGSSIYGTMHLKQGLHLFNLVSKRSYFHTYSTWENNYFTVEPLIAVCVKNENTYSLNSTQSDFKDHDSG